MYPKSLVVINIPVSAGNSFTAEVTNNLVCNNDGGQITLSGARLSGNVTSCPAFVDAEHGDFHVQGGSDVGMQGSVGTGTGTGQGAAPIAPLPTPKNLRTLTLP